VRDSGLSFQEALQAVAEQAYAVWELVTGSSLRNKYRDLPMLSLHYTEMTGLPIEWLDPGYLPVLTLAELRRLWGGTLPPTLVPDEQYIFPVRDPSSPRGSALVAVPTLDAVKTGRGAGHE
jgi:hypothetical protein